MEWGEFVTGVLLILLAMVALLGLEVYVFTPKRLRNLEHRVTCKETDISYLRDEQRDLLQARYDLRDRIRSVDAFHAQMLKLVTDHFGIRIARGDDYIIEDIEDQPS